MSKNNKNGKNSKKKHKLSATPFVSICTPTFNRRPFIPYIIKCFENQIYPKDKMEWIIIDDGTDKIEDIVSQIPQVKYFKYDEKMTLGKKRNLCHKHATGEVIVYMDDDDYYPPERVSHAVETLRKNPHALCAGSSEMHIFFKHINKMYKFGPYGPNHSTAATFAFRRELLETTSFQEDACLAEEKHFLKNYTVPFVQLESMKSILVFSHNHNSFDKKVLLENPNQYVTLSEKFPSDFVNEPDILHFFMNDIDELLNTYLPGDLKNKPDVLKQMNDMKKQRETLMKQQLEYQETMNKLQNANANANNPQNIQNKMNEMSIIIQELSMENNQLKDKVTYLESKIKELISEKIQQKKLNNNLLHDLSDS
jgi:glycosyltransferase involved in cell wall biosynthesis